MPCDVHEVLHATQDLITRVTTATVATAVMQTPIHLLPWWELPRSRHNPTRRLEGLYEGGHIYVRLLGESLLDSALMHELVAHRLHEVLIGSPNAGHAEEWAQMEVNFEKAVVATMDQPPDCEAAVPVDRPTMWASQ